MATYIPKEEIVSLVDSVNAASTAFTTAGHGDASAARRSLLQEAKKLVASLEDPSTEVWPRIFQVNVSVSVEMLSNMKIWSKFDEGKTISLAEVVEITGADEVMIGQHIFP